MVLFAVTDMKSLNPPVSQVLKTVVLACDFVALFYVVTNILEECTPSIFREIHGLNHQGSRLHAASQHVKKENYFYMNGSWVPLSRFLK
jgi:hypothetical protein